MSAKAPPESRRPSAKPRIGRTADEGKKAWGALVSFLKSKGDRVTQSRKCVCDAVMARHDHFRADDLALELLRGPNRVSRGTVYRTLALMVEAGLVRTVRDTDRHYHYEHVLGHSRHEHMICEICGSFIEFDASRAVEAIEKNCRNRGFAKHTHRIVITGVCRACAKQQKANA